MCVFRAWVDTLFEWRNPTEDPQPLQSITVPTPRPEPWNHVVFHLGGCVRRDAYRNLSVQRRYRPGDNGGGTLRLSGHAVLALASADRLKLQTHEYRPALRARNWGYLEKAIQLRVECQRKDG